MWQYYLTGLMMKLIHSMKAAGEFDVLFKAAYTKARAFEIPEIHVPGALNFTLGEVHNLVVAWNLRSPNIIRRICCCRTQLPRLPSVIILSGEAILLLLEIQ
uniref:Uncharacterized protein n=1 Tax=Physcomitrium patens TaxID=3218 RepID=A0A2K1L082_PHYPA|nr:hypothetical protein PHYPA_002229 [Physcomitrium patens]